MYKNELSPLIMLLLIDRIKICRNSYQLIKVLSRKFDIIEFTEIADYLIKNELIIEDVINQVGNYTITIKGKIYLTNKGEWLKEQLYELYPGEVDFLNDVWARTPDA